MTRTVNLASIGLGWWGNVLADAAKATGEANIVACFARTPEKRETFANKHECRDAASYEDILGDESIDGVLIATSHRSHRSLIEQAAAAGKHVFVEKPLTLGIEDGKAAVAAAAEAGVVLQVGHQRRRMTANRQIKAMLEAGELGDIEVIETHQSVPNGHKMPPEAWRWAAEESPLGGMTSLGIHKIDTLRYLGGPISEVHAFTRAGRDVSIDEVTVLSLEFESGALGTLVTSFFTPMLSRVAVAGTKGSAYMEGDGKMLFRQAIDEPIRQQVEIEPNDPIQDQLAEFAAAIRGETTPETDGDVGLAAVAVMEAAIESAATGKSVAVRDHR